MLDSEISGNITHYVLPFDEIKLLISTRELLHIFNILVYGVIYWIIGIITFNILLNIAKKRGALFNV